VPFRAQVIFYLPMERGHVAIQRILSAAQNAQALWWGEMDR
jgi:hypothetical protein